MAESETKATSETSTVFSEEQLEQIRKMLSASLSSSTSLMAKNGTIMTAFGGLTEKGEPRIINSGATDHMTGCEKMFTTYAPSPGNH